MNNTVSKALQLAWDNKERFYEAYKDLPSVEILQKVQKNHEAWITAHNPTTYTVSHTVPAYTLIGATQE